MKTTVPPIGLLAELTHRCPLSCPYCSNPVALLKKSKEMDTESWQRVFTQAAALGVLQVHLSGGEPTARADIVALTKHCVEVGLYTNLITSGIIQNTGLLQELYDVGLDHLQLSLQGSQADMADIAVDYQGAHEKKIVLAHQVVEMGLPLTINAVIHRGIIANVGEMVDLAVELGAKRIEIAHVQYYGWALKNRAALIPSRKDAEKAKQVIEGKREEYLGKIVIDMVLPDYYAKHPKPCMGGWASRSLNVMPDGIVIPCHAAQDIAQLDFWSTQNHSLEDIWLHSPGFNAFRGDDWMQEPCVSCDRKHEDFGGCRCQAFALTGDAAATDPACHKSKYHTQLVSIAESESQSDIPIQYRKF